MNDPLPVANVNFLDEIKLVWYPSSEFFTTGTTITLGDAATDEIMVAWKEGYFFLANTFINLESQIKKEQLDRLDGWNGFEKASISCPVWTGRRVFVSLQSKILLRP